MLACPLTIATFGGFMLAQAPVPSVDILLELWNLARGGVPLVVMVLIAWLYREYSERKAIQTKYDSLYERFVTLGNETNATLKDFRDLFRSVIRRGEHD